MPNHSKKSYSPSGVEESADQEVIRYNKIPKTIQWIFKSWDRRNGHIGFNELGHFDRGQTHLVRCLYHWGHLVSFDKIEDVPNPSHFDVGITEDN